MSDIIHSNLFSICISIFIYLLAQKIYVKTKIALLNPVFVSVITIMCLIYVLKIPYSEYISSCKPISILLDASVVALALPLYLKWELVKTQWKRISISLFFGSILGVVSVIFFAFIFGASHEVIISLAPKSITTPIAISVCQALGGIPALTAAVVICVGVFGAIVGLPFLKLIGVKKPHSIGLAMGAAAHGLGVARVSPLGVDYVAMGGVAIAVNGIFTAVFAPFVVEYFFMFISMF